MRTGRPTKLTPDTQARIVLAMQTGAYIETAVAFAGVDKRTLFAWLRRGRAEKRGWFAEFVGATAEAMAQADLRDLALINRAASQGHWQAAAWRLERRHPAHWGQRVAAERPREGRPQAPRVIGFNRPAAPPPGP